MSIADDLEKLASLRENGVLNEDEFQAKKEKIFAKIRTSNSEKVEDNKNEAHDILEKYWVNSNTNETQSKSQQEQSPSSSHSQETNIKDSIIGLLLIIGAIYFIWKVGFYGFESISKSSNSPTSQNEEKDISSTMPQIDIPEAINEIISIDNCQISNGYAIDCVIKNKIHGKIESHSFKTISFDNNGNKLESVTFPMEGINPGESYKGSIYYTTHLSDTSKIKIDWESVNYETIYFFRK